MLVWTPGDLVPLMDIQIVLSGTILMFLIITYFRR